MTDNLQDRLQIRAHLQVLQSKIDTLQFIYKHRHEIVDVELEITFRAGDRILLDQLLIPFALDMEIKNLIGDSIDEYQRQISNLSNLYNESNKTDL